MKAIETLEDEHRVIEQVASSCGVCGGVLRLHEHHAHGIALIQVLSGRIRARVLDEVLEAPVGHAPSLDPDLEHETEAVDESAVSITIAWPQDLDIVQKEPSAGSYMRRLASLCSIADHIEAAARPESDAR